MLDWIRKNLHINFARCLIAVPAALLSALSVSVFCYVRSFGDMGLYYAGSLANLLGDSITVWSFLLFVPLALFFAFALHAVRKPHITSGIVALLLAFNMVVSLSMENSGLNEIFLPAGVTGNLLVLLGFALLLDAFVELLYVWCDRKTAYRIELRPENTHETLKQFFAAMCVVLVCWLPVMLLCYPGSIHNDSRYQIMGWLGLHPITSSHPVLATVVYGSLYQLGMQMGGQEEALFAIVLFQALFNSAAIGLTAVYCRRYTRSRGWYWLTILFFGLLPVWQSTSQVIIKDVLHTGCYLLFYVVYLECLRKREKKWSNVILLLVTAILVAYTRKATVYLAGICIAVVAFAHWKKFFLPYLGMLAVFAGLFWFSNSVLYPLLNIGEEWKSENYSLQFQQVALYCRTYGDEMTDEEKAIINSTLDFDTIVRDYTPMISDNVKSTFHDTASDHADFWALYRQMLLRHPLLFVKGTIMTTFEHMNPWYEGINYWVHIAREEDFITVDYASGAHQTLNDFWNKCLEIPVIRMLIGTGLYAWLLIAALGYAIKKRSLWGFLGLVPSLTLFIGLFMSHVNGQIRYGYPLIAATPLIFCWLLYACSQKNGGEKQQEALPPPAKLSFADKLRQTAARMNQMAQALDQYGKDAAAPEDGLAAPAASSRESEEAAVSPVSAVPAPEAEEQPAIPSAEAAPAPAADHQAQPETAQKNKRHPAFRAGKLFFAVSDQGELEMDATVFRAGAAAILSALSVSLFGYLRAQGDIGGISHLLLNAINLRFFLAVIPLFFLYSAAYRHIGRSRLSAMLLSGVMALSLTMALSLEHTGYRDLFLPTGAAGSLMVVLGFALLVNVCAMLIYAGLDRITRYRIKPVEKDAVSTAQEFAGAFFIIILCWMPILYFCYPGSVDAAAAAQVEQWLGLEKMTTAYPLLSTAVYGLIYQLGQMIGSEDKVWLFCVLFQNILNAAAMAYAAVTAGRLTGSKIWKWAVVAFFGLLPLWENAAQLVMPEVLHLGCLLLFICQYLKCLKKDHRLRDIAGLAFWALLAAFTGSFALYVIGGCFILLLLRHWKTRLIHYAVCMTLLAGILWGSGQFLYPLLQIQPPEEDGTQRLQQIALYCSSYQEEMTEEEIAVVAGVLDYEAILRDYTPLSAEPVKAALLAPEEGEDPPDRTALWELYGQMRQRHPELFVKERVLASFEYWNPWFDQVNLRLSITQIPDVVSAQYATGNIAYLRDYWAGWLRTPVIRTLVGTGLYVWILLLALGYALKRRSLPAFLGLAPSLILLAQLLMSVESGDLRNSYGLIAATPLILSWVVFSVSQKAPVHLEKPSQKTWRERLKGISAHLETAAAGKKAGALPEQEAALSPALAAPPAENETKDETPPAEPVSPIPQAPEAAESAEPPDRLGRALAWIQNFIPIPRNPKVYLDVVKIIAIYLVLFNHTGYTGFFRYQAITELPSHLFLLLLSIFDKIAVPLFFMASGALLLGREESYKTLFKHRVLRFSIVLVVASFINYWLYVKGNEPFSLMDFLSRLYTDDVVTPLWYLYNYIAFLCMLPFLRKLAKLMKHSDYVWLLLSYLLIRLLSVADAMLYQGANYHASDFHLFTAYTYVVYVLMGYYIEKDGMKKWGSDAFFFLILASVISLGLTYLMTEWKARSMGGWANTDAQDFFNTLIVIPSMTVFYGCKLWFEKHPVSGNAKKILSLISTCTFGTYLYERTWRFSMSDLEYSLGPILGDLPTTFLRILLACGVGILATFAWKMASAIALKHGKKAVKRFIPRRKQ